MKDMREIKMWECRICSHENDDSNVICTECGSNRNEDLDILADMQDEEDN